MFYQVTAETATNEDPNMEYQHGLIQSGGCISPAWVLLDNQSAVDAFSNRRLLKNISKSDRELAILLTGVKMNTNLQGGIPGYGTVWFHPGGIANGKYRGKTGITVTGIFYQICPPSLF